jgi:tetratricopeptide (TPR) repeat protein
VRGRRHVVALACVVLATALAYANSLNGTWAFDDVVTNRPVSFNDLRDLVGFRKVAYFTFLANQQIASFDPLSFRLFNIGLHALNAVLVYFLAFTTVLLYYRRGENQRPQGPKMPHGRIRQVAYHAALLSSAVFALHPVNINAVAYIVQRMAALAAFFVLLAVICYTGATQSRNRITGAALYLLCLSSIVLGVLSKENAVIAVPLILLYDYAFIPRGTDRSFRVRASAVAGLAVACLGFAAYSLELHKAALELAGLFMNPSQVIDSRGWTAVDVYWTPLDHVMTELRVLVRYLVVIVLPLPQLLIFDWWGFPVSTGLTEPLTTLWAFLVVSTLLLFAAVKFRSLPFLSFGIFWYFTAVSLESFCALGSDFYFEHRNYLPVAGLFIGVIGQLAVSFEGLLTDKRAWTVTCLVCLALGSLTFARNLVWKDSITLWQDTLRKAPSNIRAMMALGNSYLKLPDMENASKYYDQAARKSRSEGRQTYLEDAVYSLAMLRLFSGDIPGASEIIGSAEFVKRPYRHAILRGFLKAQTKDTDGALREYQEVLPDARDVDRVVIHTLMGDALRDKGSWQSAIEQYENALRYDLNFAAAYYGIGASHLALGDPGAAHHYLQEALRRDPDHVLALADMSDLMLIQKEPSAALRFAQKALTRSPPFYQPYLSMGSALIYSGREAEAEVYYREALRRGVPAYMVPFSKARAYHMKGDVQKREFYLAQVKGFGDLPAGLVRILGSTPDK